jgi:hypothetical protein
MAEVSPVLRGAGQNTRTLEVKAEEKIQATPEPSQTDAKDLNLEQLITLLDRQIDHLTFVQEVRAQHKKRLSHDTIAMIDETSKKFERLRYAVKLPPAPSPEETVALVKEAHDVQSWLDAEASERQVQQQTANAALIESFESTFDAIQETLHPVSR